MNTYFATAQASGAGDVHRKLVYADSTEEAEAITLAFYIRLWSDLCLPITVTAELLEKKFLLSTGRTENE